MTVFHWCVLWFCIVVGCVCVGFILWLMFDVMHIITTGRVRGTMDEFFIWCAKRIDAFFVGK